MALLELLSFLGDALDALWWWRLSLCLLIGTALSALVLRVGDRTEPAAVLASLIMLLAIGTGIAWEWRDRDGVW
jgi:hypothetical protein